jgi:hypothetical protein
LLLRSGYTRELALRKCADVSDILSGALKAHVANIGNCGSRWIVEVLTDEIGGANGWPLWRKALVEWSQWEQHSHRLLLAYSVEKLLDMPYALMI